MGNEKSSEPPTESLPLAGVRVVDLTQFESGPSATQMLAWLGADVIKVEPPKGDASRALAGAAPGRDSLVYALFNQNKRSVVLDLKSGAARDALLELLERADVLTENFAPGTLERLGLSVAELRRRFPRLIVASLRGYARGGPWSDYKSLDFVAQAVGGAISVTGEAGRPPVRVGLTIADSGAGLHLDVGILAALLRRERTGSGAVIEVALQDGVVNLMRNAMVPMYSSGAPAPRAGDAFPTAVPSGLHPCKPGGPNDYVYVLLSSNRHWESLLRAIGREDLIGDPRYARQSLRNEKKDEVDEIVRAWTRTVDKRTAMQRISALGVPCGATLDTRELLDDRQLVASGMIVEQEIPGWGVLKIPACPIVIDGRRPALRPAPALGAQQRQVFAGATADDDAADE